MAMFIRAAAATAEGFSAGVAGNENALPELLRLLLINQIETLKFNFFHASKLLPHHARRLRAHNIEYKEYFELLEICKI
jgi:hypothetical protein